MSEEEQRRERLNAATQQLRDYANGTELSRLLHEFLSAAEAHYAYRMIDEDKHVAEFRGAAAAVRQIRRCVFSDPGAPHPPSPVI